jgi:hypothetical protein
MPQQQAPSPQPAPMPPPPSGDVPPHQHQEYEQMLMQMMDMIEQLGNTVGQVQQQLQVSLATQEEMQQRFVQSEMQLQQLSRAIGDGQSAPMM